MSLQNRAARDSARVRMVLLNDEGQIPDQNYIYQAVSSGGIKRLAKAAPRGAAPKLARRGGGGGGGGGGGSGFRCAFCPASLEGWKEYQSHLIKEPCRVSLFACHICLAAFQSKRKLSAHACTSPAEWAAQLSEGAVRIRSAYQYIVCGGCGLHLPLWAEGAVHAYACLTQAHTTDRLRCLSVYTAARIPAGQRHFRVAWSPTVTRLPLKCWGCAAPFSSWADIKAHADTSCRPADPEILKAMSGLKNLASSANSYSTNNLVHFCASISEDGVPEEGSSKGRFREEMVTCDLCGESVSSRDFNRTHDCATHYVRRIWDPESRILHKVPSACLKDCRIELEAPSDQATKLLADLAKCFTRTVSLRTWVSEESVLVGWKEQIRLHQLESVRMCVPCAQLLPDATADGLHHQLIHANQPSQAVTLGARLRCPLCPEDAASSWCSLDAFYNHVWARHDRLIEQITLPPVEKSAISRAKKTFSATAAERKKVTTNGEIRRVVVPQPLIGKSSPAAALAAPATPPAASLVAPATPLTWLCPICRRTYGKISDLRSHLDVEHIQTCRSCPAAFVSHNQAAVHMSKCSKRINSRDKFMCPICSIFYQSQRLYYQHLIANHESAVNFDKDTGQIYPQCSVQDQQALSADARVFPCPYCSFSTSSSKGLKAHVEMTHRPSPRLFCPVCAVTKLPDVPSLNDHLLRDHAMATNHTCPLCKRDDLHALDTNALLQHALITCNDTHSWQCQICGQLSQSKAGLRAHKLGAHMDKVRACPAGCEDLFWIQDHQGLAACKKKHEEAKRVAETPPEGVDDDDDAIIIIEPRSPKAEDLDEVKIHDPLQKLPTTGDGEEDEDGITVLEAEPSSSVAGAERQALLKCPKCSARFKTQPALSEHRKTHNYDAGLTCDAVLPCPSNVVLWICRLCSIAYEKKETFMAHSSRHGAFHSCTSCSSISFTAEQMGVHQAAHAAKKVLFCCLECSAAFLDEAKLHAHLVAHHRHAHNFLIHFCKMCGYGNTAENDVRWHVSTMHKVFYTQKQQEFVGVTSNRKLHFQPSSAKYAETLDDLESQKPGECVHRSFIAYNESLVICHTCGTAVSSSKFFMENDKWRKKNQMVLTMKYDNGLTARVILAASGSSAPQAGRAVAARPEASPVNVVRPMRPDVTQIPTVAPPRVVSAQAVSRPSAVAAVRPQSFAVAPSQPWPARMVPPPLKANQCCECRSECSSKAQLKVHRLRHTRDPVFCLDCGTSHKSSAAFAAHQNVSHKDKCPAVSLRCPGPLCERICHSEADMRIHLNSCIAVTDIVCPSCQMPMGSWLAMETHVRQTHLQHVIGDMCLFCGELDNFVHKMTKHVTTEWQMCRECGVCFKEVGQLSAHFERLHRVPESNKCAVCPGESVTEGHALSRHRVLGYKWKAAVSFDEAFSRFFARRPS